MRTNFIEYASYSILDRAIPDLRDGLKPVQRRILHTLFSMHDGRYHKVANAIGETVPLYDTYEERIKELRDWSRGRARPASTDPKMVDLFAEG